MSKSLKIDIARKDLWIDGKPLQVLGNIHFRVNEGEFASLIGPSGCGKPQPRKCISRIDSFY